MEDELRRYYESADENYQIIEGIITSAPITRRDKRKSSISIKRASRPNTLFSYKVADNGFIHGEHAWDVSSAMLFAWLFQLDQVGVRTYYTENSVGTARLLSAIYKSCQKPPDEHSTLNRYYRPRIHIKDQNPFVKALMALSLAYKIGIGEDKATKLAAKYNTVFDIIMSEASELCEIDGIGKVLAAKLLEALGRSDE